MHEEETYSLLKLDQIIKVLSPAIWLIHNEKTSCQILTSLHYRCNQIVCRLTVKILARPGNLQQELRITGN